MVGWIECCVCCLCSLCSLCCCCCCCCWIFCANRSHTNIYYFWLPVFVFPFTISPQLHFHNFRPVGFIRRFQYDNFICWLACSLFRFVLLLAPVSGFRFLNISCCLHARTHSFTHSEYTNSHTLIPSLEKHLPQGSDQIQ